MLPHRGRLHSELQVQQTNTHQHTSSRRRRLLVVVVISVRILYARGRWWGKTKRERVRGDERGESVWRTDFCLLRYQNATKTNCWRRGCCHRKTSRAEQILSDEHLNLSSIVVVTSGTPTHLCRWRARGGKLYLTRTFHSLALFDLENCLDFPRSRNADFRTLLESLGSISIKISFFSETFKKIFTQHARASILN